MQFRDVKLSNQVFGVLSADKLNRHFVVNRVAVDVSPVLGQFNQLHDELSLMTLMAEEDSRFDMNFVVRGVPFLAMNMLDDNATAVALDA